MAWWPIVRLALFLTTALVSGFTGYRLGSLQNENGNLRALADQMEEMRKIDDEIRINAPVDRNAIINRLYHNARQQ